MHVTIHKLPWSLLVLSVAIMVIGLCGLEHADRLYGPSQLFQRQLVWMLLAIPVLLAATQVPYRHLRPFSLWLYVLCMMLLAVALFMPAINGSRRWIPLGFMDFQPSEIARLAFILALADYLKHRESHRTVKGLVPPFVMTVLPMVLILKEPDLGTALLFLPVLYGMLFCAGARTRHLLIAAGVGIMLLPAFWQVMSAEQKSRIVSVFTQVDGGHAPGGDGFHLHQSKQVLALGGVWGSVWTDEPLIDDATAWRLPAARTDFIFSVIGERYGLPGCAVLLLMYTLLLLKGLRIARQTQEPFGRLAATGIVVMLGTQVVINTGMTVGLAPITGITLPLCSYGGSSLVSTSAAIGLLMNIAMRPGYEVAAPPFVFHSARTA